ncbi:redox-regulated ATPase YchF [candidate division KSB3 bacterium]|uniref:Ribosome-binding ATPase YchF n=1 Tax=candidate division KSB3 bacterium TaxID=2044937 RepID=A0A2G6E3F8_9BACT|nr:MAG: redox-regulated ATPase YchF [candidate division KSB3 bacterium]PIE29188.1 MAG: redox-regulated ATPase YchF [candidate division KSB3 bacterium]
MKAGIIGLPRCGKTTLFNVLTGRNVQTGGYGVGSEPNIGTVKVPDERIDALSTMFAPKKTTYAVVEYVDVSGLAKGSVQDAGMASRFLAHIRNVDALIHVVRTFESKTVPMPEGGIDPAGDIDALKLELILSDLAIVEKRIERLETDIHKKGEKTQEHELRLMQRIKDCLEHEQTIRDLEVTVDEARLLRGYQFLSRKPMLIVLNIGEDHIGDTEKYRELIARNAAQGMPTLALSAAIESEIAQLDSQEDIQTFMDAIGIQEPGLTRLIRVSYELLGLISFFTVGKDEVRAWTIQHDTKASQAAGTIHSDLERGFIRAEVIHYDDLMKYGSIAKTKQHGAFRVEGRDYIVVDGDIINVRFNV